MRRRAILFWRQCADLVDEHSKWSLITHNRTQSSQSTKSAHCHRPKPIIFIYCHFYSKQNGVHDLIPNSIIGRVTCLYTQALGVPRPVESHSGARENIIAGPYPPFCMSWDRDAEGVEREETWGWVSPHHLTRDSGERHKLSQRGPGRSPGRKRILCIF